MTNGIERFSPVFRPAIEMLAAKRINQLRRLSGKDFINDNQIDNTRRVNGSELRADTPRWFGAPVTPCLFFVAVGYRDDGQVVAVSVGHHSTRFESAAIYDHLESVGTPPEKTKVFMMGLGEKTDYRSLEKTSQELCGIVDRFGIPIELSWLAEDRPIMRDARTGMVVSELGWGMRFTETESAFGRRDYGRRFVFFGATTYETICLSYLMPFETNSQPYGYAFDGKQPGLEFFCLPDSAA